MRDPYEVLGLEREATPEEIRKAYRKLAKTSHPDLHPGDKAAEERFKELSQANEILSDPEKRARFDKGEIDASGAERPQHEYYRGFADGPAGERYARTEIFEDEADLGRVFADLFGQRGRGSGSVRMRGPDVSYTLEVGFLDAARGGKRTITTPHGRTLNVTIPVGVRDRQTLRLKGLGGPGIGGGEPGDAYVEIHVTPHPVFRRKDDDIHLTLPVSVKEAMIGAKVEVPTVSGPVMLSIPPRSNTGSTLRLRGKGIPAHGDAPAGDQYVRLEVVLPKVAGPGARGVPQGLDPRPCGDSPRRADAGGGTMRTMSELLAEIGTVEEVEVRSWIAEAWVCAEGAGAEVRFTETDVARVRLICDLRHDLEIEEESLPVVLSLLDQLYATRRRLRALSEAVAAEPEETRARVLRTYREALRQDPPDPAA